MCAHNCLLFLKHFEWNRDYPTSQLSTCWLKSTCKWCFLLMVHMVKWTYDQAVIVFSSTSCAPTLKKILSQMGPPNPIFFRQFGLSQLMYVAYLSCLASRAGSHFLCGWWAGREQLWRHYRKGGGRSWLWMWYPRHCGCFTRCRVNPNFSHSLWFCRWIVLLKIKINHTNFLRYLWDCWAPENAVMVDMVEGYW